MASTPKFARLRCPPRRLTGPTGGRRLQGAGAGGLACAPTLSAPPTLSLGVVVRKTPLTPVKTAGWPPPQPPRPHPQGPGALHGGAPPRGRRAADPAPPPPPRPFPQEGRRRYRPDPTPEDLAHFAASSPIAHAHKVTAPLAFMLGAKDRRVPLDDGRRYVDAVRAKGVPTRVLVFPNDTHALDKPATEFEQWLNLAWWLKQHMG
jgi:hypothetical protein